MYNIPNKPVKMTIRMMVVFLIFQLPAVAKPLNHAAMHPSPEDGKAYMTKKAFRLEYTISKKIMAKPEQIWKILTNGPDYPRWNSTVKSLEGRIEKGEKIKLCAMIDTSRTFSLKVSELVASQKMVWKDGAAPMFKGVRTYTLNPNPDGSTQFTMTEVLSGMMLPMIKGSLPDFRPSFEQYAADLEKEAVGR